MIDRRRFLLTPLALASAADSTANLLLIVARGWRGQATPWDRDPDLVAPNLETFGKQSVVFSRTYCACPTGDLALTALLTAKFPHAAQKNDEILGHVKSVAAAEMQQAFEKTPFALRMSLQSTGDSPPARVHLRRNVPSDIEPQARTDVMNFYGGCRSMDGAFGDVLSLLDKLNLSQNTVVAFTADCGQQLGSQGLVGDGVPFEESVRIPLAIRFPPKLKPDARDLASQVDIMPTLLTLAGMEIPEGVQGQNLFGRSPEEVVFSEEKPDWRVLVRGYSKLIATPKGEITHLFNLAEDPFELANLLRDPAQKLTLASLKAQLQAQMQKLGDGVDPSGLRKR